MGPGVGQDDDKDPEGPHSSWNADLADMPPVHLGLLTGQPLGPEVDLCLWCWADAMNVARRVPEPSVDYVGGMRARPR